MNKENHFSNDNLEYVVQQPDTSRDFDNYIFNESIYGYLQQTGVGYTMYQINETETTALSTFSRDVHYDRESLMNRIIYIRDNKTNEVWNVNWEPIKMPYSKFQCIHGLGYTTIENKTKSIGSRFRVFIPDGYDPVELWQLGIKNLDESDRDLSIFVYYQFSFDFKWGFDAYGSSIYQHSYFDYDNNAMVAHMHPEDKPHNYLTGFISSDRNIDSWDGSKENFIGRYNHLNEPLAVINGKCTEIEGTNERVIGAIQYDLKIPINEEIIINLVVGVAKDIQEMKLLKSKYVNAVDSYFEILKRKKEEMFHTGKLTTNDDKLNTLYNFWMKQQIMYGALWTRWGMKGYRDVVQHAYGVCSIKHSLTRSIILKALNYQYYSGAALRGWDPIDDKKYSDSALWLIYTINKYLKETGDFEILNIDVPYFDTGSGSVLEHLTRALDYLEGNKGIHGLTLIKYGDWNDSLTAIGKEGKGESVWLSMAYSYALLQLIEVFRYIDDESSADELQMRYDKMKMDLNKFAWDGDYYIGCYSDSYKKIYSKENIEGRIYLNTQSWAIISEICEPWQVEKMIHAVDDELMTPLGYLLQYPPFSTFDPEIGRITAMEPGIAENGTIYSHGNAFMMLALFKIGEIDKAFEVFKKIAPIYADEFGYKDDAVPYVFTNCYYGPNHRTNPYSMEYTWITGSVSWFYNIITEYIIGLKKNFDYMELSPQLPSCINRMSYQTTVRGKQVEIFISCVDSISEDNVTLLNGKRIDNNKIPYASLESNNRIEVVV